MIRRRRACYALLAAILLLPAGCRKDSAPPTVPAGTGGEAPKIGLGKLEEARRDRAQLQAFNIGLAAKAYWVKNGMPPEKLELLAKPPDGKPFLEDPKDLIDPWGKPFQFAVEQGADGAESLRIFTTAPDGTTIDSSRK